MPHYVDVSINLAQIEHSYHYAIPAELEEKLQPGCLVVVPFGKQTVQGVVLSLLKESEVPNPSEVQALISETTVLTSAQIELAKWLAEATFAPLGACISLMIPVGLSQHADILASLSPSVTDVPTDLPPLQARILKLLSSRGPLKGGQLDRALPNLNWRSSLNQLRSAGLVQTASFLPPPRISPKTVRTAQLSILPQAVDTLDPKTLGRQEETIQRRWKVLKLLAREPFPVDFSWIYAQTASSYADLKYLADVGWLHFNETEVWRDPLESIQAIQSLPPTLTPDQQGAWDLLSPMLDQKDKRPILLHGVTGSGKTEIYLRAVAQTLAHGKQALILVPEISMTPQAVRRFMSRFPNQVGLYHSKLTEGERYDTWRRARQGDLGVVVGARSALFVPLPKLGLIVLDECDHESYDQTDRVPFYHAVETAEALSKITNAALVLGSATPRITQYHQALKGDWSLLELPQRILAHRETIQQQAASLHISFPVLPEGKDLLNLELPPVEVIDMRRELTRGNTSVLSRSLYESLGRVLAAGQQAILFLNRKGSSTYVFCRECGAPFLCPRDESPLVYHSDRAGLLCHICGYSRKMPTKCPKCGSRQIRQLGIGTEKLESIIKSTFPKARLLRWDAETTTAKDAHELILSHFSAHRADILIGTQMLAKGLDLPLVTLVGIILAEIGLGLPDYRAAERTFQVLTQVSGRAGRSPLGGKVVMQTYQPQNYVIQAASKHNFESFYAHEIQQRRDLTYPPFAHLIRLEYRHALESACEAAARAMADILTIEIKGSGMKQTDFIGPVPCYQRKIAGHYRWQIILRGPDPRSILPGLPLRNWIVEVDPPNLL